VNAVNRGIRKLAGDQGFLFADLEQLFNETRRAVATHPQAPVILE